MERETEIRRLAMQVIMTVGPITKDMDADRKVFLARKSIEMATEMYDAIMRVRISKEFTDVT